MGTLLTKPSQEDIEWFKSLPERFNLQPKQEWSEEDEKMRNNLIELLIRLSAKTRTDSTSINYSYPREIDWLKSLHPSWKPSEEQMGALKCAIEDVKKYSSKSVQLELENEPYYRALISLYDKLKKL